MKKILTVLFVAISLFFNIGVVKAEDKHLLVDHNIRNTFNEGDEEFLENELASISDNYDINIFFIYDETIANEEISAYTENFLNNNSNKKNNVILCLNNEYYSLKASGENKDLIINSKDSIFNSAINYFQDKNYYEGIISYYQSVVKLINDATYEIVVPIMEEKSLLFDDANLLNEKEKEELINNLEEVSNKYGMDFVVVTTNSLNGKDIQAFADDFYDYNNYSNNGILFLIDMGSRQITISTKGECINIVDDQTIDYIFDNMMDDLKEGKYYDVFKTFYKDADYYIAHYSPSGNTSVSRVKHINIPISIAVGIVATICVFFILNNQLKSVAPNKFARSYVAKNSFVLTGFSDLLVNRRVSKTPRPKDTGRSSSGGGGGTSHFSHTSSSGSSHGGHSRGF